jgi:hypothetical protein
MTVQEAAVSLASLDGTWDRFAWLEALYLYGSGLRSTTPHREFSFMVIYRGLAQPAQQRQAESDLDKHLKGAVPIRRRLNFLPDLNIIDMVSAENPAFVALFGPAVTIYVRRDS